MGFTRAVRMAALAAVAATVVVAQPAAAATGEVIVFQHELTQLAVYENPKGCTRLPTGAHVLANRTDKDVTIYSDPLCLIPIEPAAKVKPGYGTHVSAVGSFSA